MGQGPQPFSFKAFISAVIERDKRRDKPGTEAPKTCPTVEGCLGQEFSQRASWDAADWQADFEERAAIIEFDGSYSRATAEAMARHPTFKSDTIPFKPRSETHAN